jgi:hypothetical protein
MQESEEPVAVVYAIEPPEKFPLLAEDGDHVPA